MTRDIEAALASHTTDYAIHGRLHDVPPHAVYDVTVDGTRAICKLARGSTADPAVEGRVMAYVERTTTVPVPRILAVAPDFFIAEWCDDAPSSASTGTTDLPMPVGTDLARTLGEGLATLHAETPHDKPGFPCANGELHVDSRDTWTETLSELLAGWGALLADDGYGCVAEEVRTFVGEHPTLFEDAGEPVLTHGWYTPEHVGTADGGVACVLDWEHALVAPAEYDVCRTEAPVFDNPNRECADGAREAFREGYASVRPFSDGFETRFRAYRAVTHVYFLVSGRIQRQRPPDHIRKLSEALVESIRETLTDLGTELS